MHIGEHIRTNVIPSNLSVTAAAKRLGVGRPALSNLLNGNAALSAKMAARLERAFGADAEELLAYQTSLEAGALLQTKETLAVARQVPHIGTIRANEISQWAESIDARALLPALLRKLISPIGDAIREIDFPAYDDSQKHGWDGRLESEITLPWVPAGASGWEFGCNKDPQQKANSDYRTRTKGIDKDTRLQTTFVFVTPHRWETKAVWAEAKKTEGAWKDVIALDAADLEVWLEHSLQAQTFLLELLNRRPAAFASSEAVWAEWANVCEPIFPHALFLTASKVLEEKMELWLANEPNAPFVVQANTTLESIACVSSMFSTSEKLRKLADRVVLLRRAEGIETLKRTTVPMIVVVNDPEIELKLADLPGTHHTIICRNRSLLHDDPDYTVDLLNSIDFTTALQSIDLHDAEIDRLSKTTGGSLTVLRREWATIPEITKPLWTHQPDSLNAVTSVVLVGAWNAKNTADQFILSYFADQEQYHTIEKSIAHLEAMNDSPLWRIAEFRGVVSKFDALAVTASLITDDEMDRFFDVAYAVLSEDDPSLDLPEDKRWTAALYDKTRKHSAVLRRSIRETLTLLEMQADTWFAHLNRSTAQRVQELIKKLLTPFTTRLIQAQEEDLPHYAEASPTAFLEIIERDLRKKDPALFGVLKPTSPGLFSTPSRTGVLWALETLAWNPLYYARVVRILARMSEVEIDDNWVNKPINSLSSLFRSWMPQTAADVEFRKRALSELFDSHPKLAWDIAMRQLGGGSRSGSYNSRPNWRTDSHGAGQPVPRPEVYEMGRHALSLALSRDDYNWRMLAECAENSQYWSEEDQSRAWNNIEEWATSASDAQKAKLKERLRKHLHITALRKNQETKICGESAWRAMDYLTPSSLIERHRWLFDGQWLPESMDEMQDERMDWQEREKRTLAARVDAAQELFQAGGVDAIIQASSHSDSPFVITDSLAQTLDDKTVYKLVPVFFAEVPSERNANYVAGLVNRFREPDEVETLVENVFATLHEGDKVAFLRCLPIGSTTWNLPPFRDEKLSSLYWKTIRFRWNNLNEVDLNAAITNVLEAKRPAMAINAAGFQWEKVETNLIERMLLELAHNHDQASGDPAPDGHEISRALEEVGSRSDIDEDRLIALEFAYMKALRFSSYDFPTIKRGLIKNPSLFVEALIWAFKRRDDQVDEERYTSVSEAARNSLAERCYDLLDQVDVIPGLDEATANKQKDTLSRWVTEVRRLAAAVSRIEVCDSRVGNFLAKSPEGSDGVWPHEAVRYAIEQIDTEELRSGIEIGVYNNRGVRTSMPYEGGGQERALSSKYSAWSESVRYDYPVTSRILSQIADTYLREAKRNDEDARLRTRLQRR